MRERSSEEEDEKEETVLREKEEEEDVIVDICAGQGRLKFLSRGRAAKTKTSVTPPLLREGNSIILEVKDLCEYAEENEENDEEKSKVPWVEHKFAIGDATHPEGLEEALLKMRVNDIAEVKIFASSEYQLCDALLPETQTITFTALFVVKVVEVTDDSVTDDKFAMSHRERLEYGEKMLERGRMLYQTKRYRRAKLMWDKGADVFSLREPQGEFDKDGEKKNKESFQVAHKIYNNLAMLHLKMENYKEAEAFASDSLDCEKDNVKALMRRAKARLELLKWEEAEKDMDTALQLEEEATESNVEKLKRELAPLRKKLQLLRKQQDLKDKKDGFGNVFKKSEKKTYYKDDEIAKENEAFPCKDLTTTQLDWDEEFKQIDMEEAEAVRWKGMKEREHKYNLLRFAHDPEIYMNNNAK
jgi:tetratricopeptide (TPR) repeat protein